MAERRMFAKSIVLSDAFLDMPLSARCLYFTLGMLADDDGFVGNPKSIIRQCGASQDDMSVLLQKRYVLGFESGVIVIKHWRMNNYLRNDRYQKTTYLEEKDLLNIDERGAYTEKLKHDLQVGIPNMGIPSIGKDSIGKDSIGKDNILSADAEQKKPKHKYGEYSHVLLTDDERNQLVNDYGQDETLKAIAFLDAYIEEKGYKAKSHYLSIKRWVFKAVKENSARPDTKSSQRNLIEEIRNA